MKQLPKTSEEIISIVEATVAAYSNSPVWYKQDIKKYMIEFAKLHVQAALESAAEKLPYDDKLNQDMLVKQSILNAYPLDKIK